MTIEKIAEDRLKRIVRLERAGRRVERAFRRWWADDEGDAIEKLVDAMNALNKELRR